MLNWVGLVVTGVVAFILPMVISLHARSRDSTHSHGQSNGDAEANGSSGLVDRPYQYIAIQGEGEKIRVGVAIGSSDSNGVPTVHNGGMSTYGSTNGVHQEEQKHAVWTSGDEGVDASSELTVEPLPRVLWPHRRLVAVVIILVFAGSIGLTVTVDVLHAFWW